MKRGLALAIVAAVLGLTVAGTTAQDKALTKVNFALTTKDISVGHAAHTSLPVVLGYWKDEGLDVTVASVEGSTAGAQQLGAGNLHVISVGPEVILISREKGIKIKSFYVQARETIFRLVVPEDIKTAMDLKGKTIGVPSLASGSVPYTKTLIASAGLDPEKDIKLLAVGVGAPGALALQQKKVDALGVWDTLQASMENRGLQFRQIATPVVREMIGQSLAVQDAYMAENPKVLVGVARGIARATLFGLTNPEAAVRLHWKTYPQSKPQGVEEAKALKEAIHVFKSRFELQRVDHRDDKRYGAATVAQWARLAQIYRDQGIIEGRVKAEELYSDALIDEINKLDRDAVIRQARGYRF